MTTANPGPIGLQRRSPELHRLAGGEAEGLPGRNATSVWCIRRPHDQHHATTRLAGRVPASTITGSAPASVGTYVDDVGFEAERV
jgi:hypothetical protein